jgi:SAM-dependent methyltransferase
MTALLYCASVTQNIYDDPAFFAGYSALRRSREGLAGALEWSALRPMLPELSGLRVLDLGCGFGWFCRWARSKGAASVVGVDVSENMLTQAIRRTTDEAIRYERSDLESFTPSTDAFDLVWSSLALHYLVDVAGLLARVHDALTPGGRLVASVEHPIYTAPTRPGWRTEEDGRRTWPIDNYATEGSRVTDWLAPGAIKQHRTVETWFNLLRGADFMLGDLREWTPTSEDVAAEPELAVERARPMFLLFSATRG